MKTYKKNKTITSDGIKYTCDAWDIAGYLNSRGVHIERIIKIDGKVGSGYLLRFNHYEKGESGKRIFMDDSTYDAIKDGYNPYDTTRTWTIPFLNFIGR